jgi:pimeloyl-ACP methyl ester carboxylesterase
VTTRPVHVRKITASGKLIEWEAVPEPADCRQMITTAAVAIDKSQLLAGDADGTHRLLSRRPRSGYDTHLIMAGDRDVFCSPEEAVRAFRRIAGAELAIVPNRPHMISPEMVGAATEFLQQRGLD